MIRVEKVSKAFRGKPALEEVSLRVDQGEIYGLLGHNGAGKSTTFGILLGQIHPDAGETFIRGESVQRCRRTALSRLGAIFETPGFYEYLSGWDNLRIFASYTARVADAEIREVADLVGLSARIREPVRVYSHGMRQRLALAQALLPEPEIVLLDEPTEGLDPEGIHEFRLLIRRLRDERGLTILLSSHLLSEVEQLCTRVGILNRGRLVFEGGWAEILGDARRYRLELDDWRRATPLLRDAEGLDAGTGVITLAPEADIADVVAALVGGGIGVRAVEPLRPTLEQFYLDKTNP